MSQRAVKESTPVASPRNVDFQSDLYREVFARSKEAIAIISPEGYYLEQNGAHFVLLGYSDDELQGQTPAIHLGDETFKQIANQLIETGEYSGEVISRTKNGEEKNIELSAFAMRNGLGEPICYVGIKRDVTARKLSEEKLRYNELQLTDFFENASIAMHWVSADGTILRANRAELDLLGYTQQEYVGQNIASFHVDPEAIRDMLSRLRAGEVLTDYEARLRCKDGSIRFVRISSSVYRENGKFIHSRSFTQDFTDRRRTEHRLALQYAITKILSRSMDFVEGTHEILETVCESIGWQMGVLWAVDHQNKVLRCVDVWHQPSLLVEEFASVSRQRTFQLGQGLPGRIWTSAEPAWIPNVTTDDNFPRAQSAKRSGLRSAFGFPVLLGREVLGVIEFFSQEIREPDQELLDMIQSVGEQIGQFQERMRTEEKLAQLLVRERSARADSDTANRLKDEFLATLSHELRTPLNAVIGWSRILKSGRLDPDSTKHAIDVVERNAWAQKQIIEDILDVSRVITGKLQLNLSPVDLVFVTNAALDAVRPALEAKDIKVETHYQRGMKIVSGDADRLQQVVWNLLSNASKFTPHGGKVNVNVSQNDGHAQIQISDSGPGVASDFLPHVFERFRQADGSTTRTHGGLGLGLAIVRHLVELHGGVIGVANAEKSGAIFTVSLPLPTGELQLEHRPAIVDHSNLPPSTEDLQDLRILVVEDEADALDLITMELAEHGAKVQGVASAEEALEALNSQNFDLMISDIGMAKTDGYSLIRQLRSRHDLRSSQIPAIALTAYARAQDRVRAIAAGYNTHIAKPVETRELVTIARYLTGRLDESDGV
ncbi:MAG: hypothetical protein C5B55_00650 [Blastocatellia bacterium]|nr:MAG: hypothetical protein C5B55_00650 [Blastocatellia bacterium]